MSDPITLPTILIQFIYPQNIVLLLLFVTFFLLLFRHLIAARIILLLALIVIFVGSSPISSGLYREHEKPYLPVAIAQSPPADAIVLLTGEEIPPWLPELTRLMNTGDAIVPSQVITMIESMRVVHAMRLYQASKAPIVIVSGGRMISGEEPKSEAAFYAELLEKWGIPGDAIVLEDNSRNTYENAIETAKLLRENNIGQVLLVTDGLHMPRAFATFTTVGVAAVPSTSSVSRFHKEKRTRFDYIKWLPSLGEFQNLERLIYEKIGTLVYRVHGWIKV